MNYELLKEMINCAKRECGFRERVYPRFIMQGKMTDSFAAREKYLMKQIAGVLEAIYNGDAPSELQQAIDGVLK